MTSGNRIDNRDIDTRLKLWEFFEKSIALHSVTNWYSEAADDISSVRHKSVATKFSKWVGSAVEDMLPAPDWRVLSIYYMRIRIPNRRQPEGQSRLVIGIILRFSD